MRSCRLAAFALFIAGFLFLLQWDAWSGESSVVPDSAKPPSSRPFVHPGLLQGEDDFKRIQANLGREPWKSGWEKLCANRYAQLAVRPRPAAVITRGKARGDNSPENYAQLFRDAAAAYNLALRWRISGDDRYADKAAEVLNAWGGTLTEINPRPSDSRLAAGIYGGELANAAEIMRGYKGWRPEDFARFQGMMNKVFLPLNEDFLERHNGQPDDHYWANWDACNLSSLMAIGILCDDRTIYDKAIAYFKTGRGMGSIKNAVVFIHPGGLGEWQESGRDQPHSIMGLGLLSTVCEMAWHQGDDLYGYDGNRLLAGAEFIAKYNLGEDVPFKEYARLGAPISQISANGRGEIRPVWEMIYNHYVKRRGLNAPFTQRMAERSRPEGGGGDYSDNSGGFDALGFGTLLYTRDGE